MNTLEFPRIIPAKPALDDAIRLTSEGFSRPVSDAFSRGIEQILKNCDLFYRLEEHDRVSGYGAFKLYEHGMGRILYISSIMTSPKLQGGGWGRAIMNEAVADTDSKYLSFKTQSPRMYAAAQKMVDRLFPDLDGEPIPDDISELGSYIAAQRKLDFPVHRGSYELGAMYGERPQHALGEKFYNLFDFEAGDAVVCIGRVALLN